MDSSNVLRQVYEAAGPYLDSLAERPVFDPAAMPLLAELAGTGFPENGIGAEAAVAKLLRVGTAAATASAGPRFFHYIVGGATPAALAADWTVSLLDQMAAFQAGSPLATETERVAVDWLRQLFGLPQGWGGVLTSSATLGNVTGLAAATHWWAEGNDADVARDGLAGLPPMPVLSGGYVHPSARKALQLLGHGRDRVEVFARDSVGRVDLGALERRLAELDAPSVIIGNAGEVNAGDFDPIADLAELASRYGAWLHVDGAFGIFAAVSPRTAHLVRGVERADSIAGDAHKWLNVPYESGFALIRDPDRLAAAFGMPGAAYLPGAEAAGPPPAMPSQAGGGYAMLGPESSRRARSLPIWATLAAYGRDGYREMIEGHLDLAQRLAAAVDAAPELERLAETQLCIVCFRAAPAGVAGERLDDLNRRLGAALLDDGRVFAGTTVYDGKVALRPAIVNWRTTESDVDQLVQVVRELVDRLGSAS